MPEEYQSIAWKAHEYEHKTKSSDWFWALGIVSVAGAIVAIIVNNVLFAILILVATFTLALYALRKPNVIHFEVHERGINADSVMHPYTSLDSFWIHDTNEDRIPELILKSKKTLMPYIIIPLDEELPYAVREFLLDYLEEEEYVEPFSTKIMHHLGF